jgi:phosphate:Na+ symporter
MFHSMALREPGKLSKVGLGTFIDPRLLNTPGVAIAQCNSRSIEMAQLAGTTVLDALSLLKVYDEDVSKRVVDNEDKLDLYEDKLGTMLVKLSSRSISKKDSKLVNKQLHTIGDLERMGDHAMNFRKSAKEMFDKKLDFSEKAKAELAVLNDAVTEIIGMTVKAYSENDLALAKQIEPLEQVVDRLIAKIKAGHIQRLQEGLCTIELGFILNDLLNSYRRTSDHCSNVAVALIETEQNAFEAHEYLQGVKHSGNIEYEALFALYREKYRLPKSE